MIARPIVSSLFQLDLKHGCHVGRRALQSISRTPSRCPWKSEPSGVKSAWQSASRRLINAQCHSVFNLGDGVFTGLVSTLSRFGTKPSRVGCNRSAELVFSRPFTDQAPTGTACQQMNFLIRLSLGLAIQTRASEGGGFSAGPLQREQTGKAPRLLHSLEKQMGDEGAPRRSRDSFRKSYIQIILRIGNSMLTVPSCSSHCGNVQRSM